MRPCWLPADCRGGYQPPESLLPSREKVPSVCEADEGWTGMAKALQRASQCPAPTKEQKRFYVRRRGGCPHPPALEGAPFVGHGLPDTRSAYPQNGVGAAHWAARRTPPHSLGPTATKALSKRGVPSFRSLPVSGSERRGKVNRLSHPRLCDDGLVCLIGGPRKTGVQGPTPLIKGRWPKARGDRDGRI